MGRKRKVTEPIVAYANEVNASTDTKSDGEKLHLNTENLKDTEAMDAKSPISNSQKLGKSTGGTSVAVKRSPCLSSLSLPTESHRVLETVNLVEDEKEQEPQAHHHDSIPPVANGRTLEEKVDYVIGAADSFKSKIFRAENEVPCSEISYKSLYLDSQKKIEALVEENYELVRKLEFARGKIAAYETMKDALGAQKEFLLVSTLEKAENVTARLSTPQDNAPQGAGNPKPKRVYRKQVK